MKTRITLRRVGVVAAAVAVGLLTSVSTPTLADAAPAPLAYVNLGDSYSAGSGVSPTAPDKPGSCTQSSNNFSHVIARRNGFSLKDVSCGGAQTKDFFTRQYPDVAPQLRALRPTTQLVTLMIGGNDGNVFAGTVAKCVAAGVAAGFRGTPCKDQYGSSVTREIQTATYPKIVNALKAIRAKSPRARVAIVSYPLIMPATAQACPNLPVAAGDLPYAHGIQTALNDAVKRAATTTGVTFVDATTPSIGHDGCKPVGVRWVEPIFGTVQPIPVHPNALGEREMAGIVSRTLGLAR